MIRHHSLNQQAGPVSAIMPIFGTASAFVSPVGLTIVMGGAALGMM